MRILLAHNFYQQPGGEDEVFRSEYDLLRSYGHAVTRFTLHNDGVDAMGRLALLGATVWNPKAAAALREQIRVERPDVVHFHNTFPLMSPAAYAAARAEGAAVVQTLHNFRLVCPGALLMRDGKACEECLHKAVPLPAIKHKCYRGNRAATAAVATMLTVHRAAGTYRSAVDVYLAPSRFAAGKLVEGGLPADKIVVKPNFVHPEPPAGPGGGGYAAFVGRLSPEKGVEVLLAAWERVGSRLPLTIVGDGPMAPLVKAAAARNPAVRWAGRKKIDEVYELLGRADLAICPSTCYETFGRVAAEAFATGTPVVASGHGAFADIVDPGRTGSLFRPGDAGDLAAQVLRLVDDPAALVRMRGEARRRVRPPVHRGGESRATGRRIRAGGRSFARDEQELGASPLSLPCT